MSTLLCVYGTSGSMLTLTFACVLSVGSLFILHLNQYNVFESPIVNPGPVKMPEMSEHLVSP